MSPEFLRLDRYPAQELEQAAEEEAHRQAPGMLAMANRLAVVGEWDWVRAMDSGRERDGRRVMAKALEQSAGRMVRLQGNPWD
mmetsp:Transcript_4589/g.16437  ORF Transcript_4589/g.16437 Transcript_4589/m.16437 type:complete len:83 (+) Transcript_4589:222-470(+)